MTVHVIPLPWTTPPLSLNDRGGHMVRHRATQATITQARWAIRATGIPPLPAARVYLHYRVPDQRRRDADNLAPTLKAVQDALVAEGVLPDDSGAYVPASGQELHPPAPGEPPAMWLTVHPVEPVP